jgi:2-polyprenyl-3-methyl-5-hydroxy-6-metoxy-1,4-benzoquinol methylase
MKNYLLSLCYRLGIPPTIWMMHNPIKIYEYLEVTQYAHLKPADVVLDLGCGQGFWTMDLARQSCRVVGVDISEGAIDVAHHYIRNSSLKNKAQFYQGRLETLELTPHSFDAIFSFCVLEHIGNLSEVLQAARHILRPGGQLHVSVDSLGTITDPAIKAKHRRDHHVVQYFSVEILTTILQTAGFDVHRIYPILTSAAARDEFQKRILGRNYYYSLFKRRAMVKRLGEEDRRKITDQGIMLVAHASRL